MLTLFDYEAAFPSLSRDFTMECLSRLGLPANLLQAIRALYYNNLHILKMKGHLCESFTASSGVRQGCPLSPLLFVLCVDVLLRRLQQLLPEACFRAFADDNVCVMPNCITSGNLVLQLYPDFGNISNLKLNLPKTVLIALWPCILKQMRSTLLRDTFPEWCSAKLDTWGRYLGFAVGPGRESHSWDKAIDKYVERSDLWSGFSLGLHVAAQIYN